MHITEASWMQGAETLEISARSIRRLRRKVQRWGMSAVTEQRGGLCTGGNWFACSYVHGRVEYRNHRPGMSGATIGKVQMTTPSGNVNFRVS